MIPETAIAARDEVDQAEGDPRAVIADWLAGLFAQPLTVEVVESFDVGADAAMLDLLDGDAAFRPGIASIRAALFSQASAAERARRLATEFTLLFEGPGGPNTVPLYASAYLNEHGRLFQEATAEMEALLRRLDLAVTGSSREPADHLAIELATLAHLGRLGKAGRADAARLNLHMLSWACAFERLCATTDRTGFYAGAAALLTALLASEASDEDQTRAVTH